MRKPKLSDEDYPTTGHEWDGIREYDKPMPRWWLWTFYATILFALVYVVFYPAIPLVNGATPGVLGWSTRADLAAEVEAVSLRNADIDQRLLDTPIGDLGADPDLTRYATAGGAAVFRTYCSQCHGAGAQGAKGYPNLQDDDWLWGGDLEAIVLTLKHGIRDDGDDDTRFSQMPAFGDILETGEIDALTQYVLSLSGQDHDADLAAAGPVLFEENCASCHGETGLGEREQGAPNLTDAIWLFGGDAETIGHTITFSRYGMMPAWNTRISEAQIKQVAFYVHQLGGGE